MKFIRSLIASVFALGILTQVADAKDTGNSSLTDDEVSDIRVECIEEGIAAELDDEQMDTFVEQCVKDEVASRKNNRGSQG